jgi:hypothetical protein
MIFWRHKRLSLSTLKMEAECASETSVTLPTSTWSEDPGGELKLTVKCHKSIKYVTPIPVYINILQSLKWCY